MKEKKKSIQFLCINHDSVGICHPSHCFPIQKNKNKNSTQLHFIKAISYFWNNMK